MITRVRRYTLPLLGAGSLALVAVASFLILGLTGAGPDSASDLPVVDIGQTGVGLTGQEASEGLPSTTAGTSPGAQAPMAGQQGVSGGPGSTQSEGGTGQPVGPGQQSGPGQQGGSVDQGGNGRSSLPNTTAPSTETSPGTSIGNPPDTTAENVSGPGTTGSTLRQTVSGGVRVEGGPGTDQGTGTGSTPATTGGGR
jgi:hypothetical protein